MVRTKKRPEDPNSPESKAARGSYTGDEVGTPKGFQGQRTYIGNKEVSRETYKAMVGRASDKDLQLAQDQGLEGLKSERAQKEKELAIKKRQLGVDTLQAGQMSVKEQIAADPNLYGFQRPGQQPDLGNFTQTSEDPQTGQKYAEFEQLDEYGNSQTIRLPITEEQFQQMRTQPVEDVLGAAALGLGAGLIGTSKVWSVAGKEISSPTRAIVAGTSNKWGDTVKGFTSKVPGWAKTALAVTAGAVGLGKINSYLDQTSEKQQAVNTLGQITSTIVGESKTGAGDYQKGLQELYSLRQAVLELESSIKTAGISSQTIKYDGRIYDLNADIYDQLRTIDEGIADLQEFALQGDFPELTPQEQQDILRELEQEGYIQAKQPEINVRGF